MEWSPLLLDLIPVLIFVVLDSMGKIRYAVIAAVLAASLELFFSHFFLGGVDKIALIYVSLFLIFGSLSYKFNNSLFFKFKPVAVSGVSAVIFLVTWVSGNPFMVLLMERYSEHLPAQLHSLYATAQWEKILTGVSFYMIFGLLAHAALVAWVAVRLNTWWWFVARNGGFFLIAVIVVQLSM